MIGIQTEPQLLAAVMDICRRIRDVGGRVLMVGGCVRDAMQNMQSKDIDLECYGVSAETIQNTLGTAYDLDLVGMSFGVFKVHHYDIDIALPRRENKTGAGHRGFMVDCVPDLSCREAAARRDFTINAMMYDPLAQELIDPWNGKEDLQKGVLRHVSSHFAEDPLRVLRAMQFAARFDFHIAPETVALCRTIPADELAMERISAEWDKLLLKGKTPARGLRFLRDCNWIEQWKELFQNETQWQNMISALDRYALTRSGKEKDDRITAVILLCAHLTEQQAHTLIGKLYSFAGYAREITPFIPVLHSINDLANAPDRILRRTAFSLKRLDLLIRAATSYHPDELEAIGIITARAESLGILREPPCPILQGRDLIARGFKPGKEMGALLQKAFDAQLDGVFSNREGAEQWLCDQLSTQ